VSWPLQAEARHIGSAALSPLAVVDDNLGFAKDRTISRLTEMQVGAESFLVFGCCFNKSAVWLQLAARLCADVTGAERVATVKRRRALHRAIRAVPAALAFLPSFANQVFRYLGSVAQSEEYLRAHAKAHAPELLLALREGRAARMAQSSSSGSGGGGSAGGMRRSTSLSI
jgi:uncharacterized membrane protein YgcG